MFRRGKFLFGFFLWATALGAQPLPSLSADDLSLARQVLAHASEDGLDPRGYAGGQPDAVYLGLLRYMTDLEQGRAQLEALDRDVSLPLNDGHVQRQLDEALRSKNLAGALSAAAPPYPEYAALKASLAHYRAIAAKGGWPSVSRDSDDAFLLKRLSYEDDKALSSSLADALKRFQARHGLAADGALGPATIAALNVSAADRADTILANMERWRWLPRTLEPDRIMINAADARLTLILAEKPVLSSRVIVGKPRTPTPILRAEGAGVTINPPWNVPPSIAAKEILPQLKRNPAWLVGQDMVLVDGPPGDPQGLHVNWRAIKPGTFPYRVRQMPGAKNALGRIKLELPNQFNVYLHDTPGKSAFKAANRDVSHGCVRVEQILPLATYALQDPAAAQTIAAALQKSETSYLPLQKKLPVYFLYWTAFVDADSGLNFRSDIYGRDSRMLAALQAGLAQSEEFVKCA